MDPTQRTSGALLGMFFQKLSKRFCHAFAIAITILPGEGREGIGRRKERRKEKNWFCSFGVFSIPACLGR